MAGDFLQGQAVKTERDNEFKVKLVDYASGTASTKGVNAVTDGDTDTPGTNDTGVPVIVKTSNGKLVIPNADDAGNLFVVPIPGSGSGVVEDYKEAASVTSTDTHDKVVTSGKKAVGIKATVSSLGLFRWDLGTWNGTLFTKLKTKYTSPAHPEADMSLATIPTGDGTLAVRILATNEEGTSQTACSTLSWDEV